MKKAHTRSVPRASSTVVVFTVAASQGESAARSFFFGVVHSCSSWNRGSGRRCTNQFLLALAFCIRYSYVMVMGFFCDGERDFAQEKVDDAVIYMWLLAAVIGVGI